MRITFAAWAEAATDSSASPDLCNWVDTMLSAALVHLQKFRTDVNAPHIARVLLKLLALRAATVSRANTADRFGAAGAFEPVLAYYLAFQSVLPRKSEYRSAPRSQWRADHPIPADWVQLDEVLLAAVASAALSEYEGALQTVEALLSSLITAELATAEAAHLLDQLLSTMSILLVSGPEGKSRRSPWAWNQAYA